MNEQPLLGKRIFFFGKLAGATRRRAALLVREQGGAVSQSLHPKVNLVVIGEAEALNGDFSLWSERLDEATREAFENGTLETLSESAFWDILSQDQSGEKTDSYFTATMLAELLELPIATIRLWERRELIVPVKMVRNLAYYDFQEVLTAKTIRDLLQEGLGPKTLEKRLRSIERIFPDIERPLAQLSVILEGKDVLLRKGEELIDQQGQRRIDFDALESEQPDAHEVLREHVTESDSERKSLLSCLDQAIPMSGPDVSGLCELALALEAEGDLKNALAAFRAALVAEGPDAEICFQVAELLYRLGDLSAARERYYMVLEIEEEHLEARANLGCVLAELGEWELAVGAFEGTLRSHPAYADVHYHLGMLYWNHGFREKAKEHFDVFTTLHPENPWVDRIHALTGEEDAPHHSPSPISHPSLPPHVGEN